MLTNMPMALRQEHLCWTLQSHGYQMVNLEIGTVYYNNEIFLNTSESIITHSKKLLIMHVRHGEIPTPPNQLIKAIDKNVRNCILVIRNMGDRNHEEALQTWFGTRSLA